MIENCNDTHVQCKEDAKWIHHNKVCDRRKDCKDGSDEIYEIFVATSMKNNVICLDDNGKCVNINRHKICDGRLHCKNGEDENNCSFCRSDRPYKCPGTTKCIKEKNVCDGRKNNCPDNGDENHCHFSCPENRPYKCQAPSTKCIKWEQVCNSRFDCEAHDDEQNCSSCSTMTPHSRGKEVLITGSHL